MSYQLWDERAQQLLDNWVLNVSTELISKKSFSDVGELMLVSNDFELLTCMSSNWMDEISSDWISLRISSLASSLSQMKWDSEITNQHIYQIMKDISNFIQINDLSSTALDFSFDQPIAMKIPDHQQYPITLDW